MIFNQTEIKKIRERSCGIYYTYKDFEPSVKPKTSAKKKSKTAFIEEAMLVEA